MKVSGLIESALGRVFTAAQLEVRVAGKSALSGSWGYVDPEERLRPTRADTLFDIASITKLFTTTAFMSLVAEGKVSLDDPVSSVLVEFVGQRPLRAYENPLAPGEFVEVALPPGVSSVDEIDAGRVTFRDLLCHASGLPAWRPLYLQGSRQAAMAMAIGSFFSYPRRARVVYSDIGLILVGLAVERLSGLGLDQAVKGRVLEPLGLRLSRYFPAPVDPMQIACRDIAPAELCAWRKRRIVGEVHDENAAALGGVAGHAGLFSTADELARFGDSFMPGRESLLGAHAAREMRRLQAEDGAVRRGVGFALWSPDPEAASNPLSPSSFGHLGFTGTSLWMDPERDLVVACATNRVYYGRAASEIGAFRVALHKAIAEAVDRGSLEEA
jgi:serine-type D-Ala-D-Ala carboxypeptidase